MSQQSAPEPQSAKGQVPSPEHRPLITTIERELLEAQDNLITLKNVQNAQQVLNQLKQKEQ